MNKGAKREPLVRSSAILRGFATALTLTSLSGMTVFAATHVQNTNAPLKPAAAAAATPTAAPTRATTTTSTRTSRRTTVTSGVATTTAAPRTRTAQS